MIRYHLERSGPQRKTGLRLFRLNILDSRMIAKLICLTWLLGGGLQVIASEKNAGQLRQLEVEEKSLWELFKSEMGNKPAPVCRNLKTRSFSITMSSDAAFKKQDERTLYLERGSFFIEASKDLTLVLSEGSDLYNVLVPVGNVVLISADKETDKIYTMFSNAPVELVFNDTSYKHMASGEAVMVSSHSPALFEIFPNVAVRKVRALEIHSGAYLTAAEFSFSSCVLHESLMQAIYRTNKKGLMKKLARESILKDDRTHGQFLECSPKH